MENRIDIYKNGVLLPAPISCSVTLAKGGQSQASITLTPAHSMALSETDEYDVALVYEVDGNDSPQWLMKKAHAVTNARSFTADPLVRGLPDDGVQDERTIQLVDRFAKFRSRAPRTKKTILRTTLKRELKRISGLTGMPQIVSLLPDVKIDRVDYVPETPYWSSLQPWLAPFQPDEVLDPVRGELRLYDPHMLRSTAPSVNRKLTLSDYNNIEYSSAFGDIVTQVRVDYLLFGWAAGLGPSESLTASRRDEDWVENDDGSKTYTWVEIAELKIDPDDPDEEPRTVILGNGQTRTLAGATLVNESNVIDYVDNYTRPVRVTATTLAQVPLPGAGVKDNVPVSTVVTEMQYVADELLPGRYFLVREDVTTSGLYYFPSVPIEVDPEREVALAGATPAVEASHAGAVATESNAAQEWAIGTMFVEETVRTRLESKFVLVAYTKTDVLRKKLVAHSSRIEQGDNETTPQGVAKFKYFRSAVGPYGDQVAARVDGTRIGYNLARQIALRLLALSGVPSKACRMSITVPNYTRLRLGYLATLDVDALDEMAGTWAIQEVSFRMGPAPSQQQQITEPQVTQQVVLARTW